MENLVYPRGFVLSRQGIIAPANFIAGPIFDNFFVDSLSSIEFASNGDVAVVILGTCVSTEADEAQPSSTELGVGHKLHDMQETPAQRMLRALLTSKIQFFDTIDQYCGRHVIIFGPKDRPCILNDATGMRTVFYAAEGGVVASHARLVEEVLGGEIKRISLPYRYGFPGNHTPYTRTRLLTPNTLYNFAEASVVRFWPRGSIKELTPQAAADIASKRATAALKRVAAGRRVSLSVTAGIDSRTVLALAVDAGITFDGYTYDRGERTAVDCNVARELARIAEIEHHVISTLRPTPPDLKGALDRATYYDHHHTVVRPMQEHFAGKDALTITANLLEIGRFFYKRQSYASNLPDNPRSMRDLALTATNWSANEISAIQGSQNAELMREYFADFIRDSDFNAARGILDPRDQFYWEHRMSAWHGMILLERDFYADCFIPFNCRSIFETLLGVPETDRRNATAFKMIIDRCAPQLVSTIPINPAQWPLEQPSAKAFSGALLWMKAQTARIGKGLTTVGSVSAPWCPRKR